MTESTIEVDMGDEKSIRRAIKEKNKLEKEGYSNVGTKQVGLEKYQIKYRKMDRL